MNTSASQLAFVVLLIGWKSGASFFSQSCGVESAKPITFRHLNENALTAWLIDPIDLFLLFPCTSWENYRIRGKLHSLLDFFLLSHAVDTSCPEALFEKVGCFTDSHIVSARPLPDYLFNDRDNSINNFSGRRIDWVNWDVYVPEFACRCAAAAKAKNHTFFGMQFYGK